MSEWFANGQSIDTVDIRDRAVQYGDGLFETIAIRNGRPRFWPLHIERLQLGCHRLGIDAPDDAGLAADLDTALRRCAIDTTHCAAKIIVTAGPGQRGYRRSGVAEASVWVGIFDSRKIPASAYKDGIDVRLCHLRLAEQPQLAGLKSLNRLEQVMASAEWDDRNIFEGLMLDSGDRLICGTMSNVFIVTANSLKTPAITRCGVAGIMRRHLLAIIGDAGIDCEVADISVDESWAADEIFLTNSQFGVLPVRRCGRHAWSQYTVSRRIMALAAQNSVPECRI